MIKSNIKYPTCRTPCCPCTTWHCTTGPCQSRSYISAPECLQPEDMTLEWVNLLIIMGNMLSFTLWEKWQKRNRVRSVFNTLSLRKQRTFYKKSFFASLPLFLVHMPKNQISRQIGILMSDITLYQYDHLLIDNYYLCTKPNSSWILPSFGPILSSLSQIIFVDRHTHRHTL